MSPEASEPSNVTVVDKRMGAIDIALFIVCAAELLFVGSLLWKHIASTRAIYERAIASATNNLARESVILGFGLVLVGALYVLKVTNEAFQLKAAAGDKGQLSFASTSAGLVLATLGVVVVLTALFSKSEVSLEGSWKDLRGQIETASAPPPHHEVVKTDTTATTATAGPPARRTKGTSAVAPTGNILAGKPKSISVHFAEGASDFKESETDKLRVIANALRDGTLEKVLVVGNGDPSMSDQEALAVGDRRANTIKEAIVKLGGPSGIVRTISYGESPSPEHSAAQTGADVVVHLFYSH